MFVPGLLVLFTLLFGPVHSEASLESYPRVTAPTSRDRVLIIAPHIDDEIIGAGGYALDAIANGSEVYIAFLTAGDCNRFSALLVNKTLGPTASSYLSVGRARIAEAHAAMKLMGVAPDHYFVLGYPDRGLKEILDNRDSVISSRGTRKRAVPYDEAMSPGSPYSFASLMSDVEQVIEVAKPTTVIAPVSFDGHEDHAAAAEIVDIALQDLDMQPRRLGYLVHNGRIQRSLIHSPKRALAPPVRMRALTWGTYGLTPAIAKRKDAILQTYKSQGPYISLLRNAFVRTNELFFVYDDAVSVNAIDQPRTAIAR
ncbi:MAG TPA: PIG-L family deacetylase [Thermoanaerobaculia bacterium]|jgi:LmbE family N-acetylglucosaminyl deacetylase